METKASSADSRVPIALVASEDLVVGRALVLLLRGSGYEVKFLTVSSLSEQGALEGVRLLLIAPAPPELSTERREALLAALRDTPEAAKIPVLELVWTSQETPPEGLERDRPWHIVPWPCRIEELEWRIEAALSTNRGADPGARKKP